MKSRNLVLATAIVTIGLAFACCSKDKGQQPGGEVQQTQQAPHPSMGNTNLVAELEGKLRENPKDTQLLWQLADVYFESKQFEQSSVYYKKVLAIKSGETDLYNDLGLSLHYLGNSAEALKYVEEGINKNPYHQRIWLTKGFILAYGSGDMEGAKAAWEKANALNPESQIGKAAAEYLSALTKK